MNEQSIEFQSLDDPLSPQAIRKSLRIPLDESGDTELIIEKTAYKLADISTDGVNIVVPDDCEWTVNDKVENCDLNLRGTVIKGLCGTLVHFSQQTDGQARFGIKWDPIKGDAFKKLEATFADIKKEYLLKGQSDSELEE